MKTLMTELQLKDNKISMLFKGRRVLTLKRMKTSYYVRNAITKEYWHYATFNVARNRFNNEMVKILDYDLI